MGRSSRSTGMLRKPSWPISMRRQHVWRRECHRRRSRQPRMKPSRAVCASVAIEPVSNYILLEHPAEARDHDTWSEAMTEALAPLKCHVIQSTSDEAPGLLAYVEHHLGAHHSPDLFHVQHELSTAVSAPMAAKQRAAAQVMTKAEEMLKRMQAQ